MMCSESSPRHGIGERKRFLEAVLESAIDYAIIGLDLDGMVVEWTEGARRVLGWDADGMIGRHASTFFSAEDVAAGIPEAEMRGAREHGRASDERWHMHQDGTRFYALGEMMPLRDEDGRLIGYLKILRDRTAQKLAEDALHEREAFLSSVLSSSGDCIKVLDLDGRLSFMTDTGQRVMEVSDFGALCGLSWPTLWESGGRGAAESAVITAREGGVGRFQGLCPTMKGSPRRWDVVVTPVRGADGKVVNLLVVSRDITAMDEAQSARHAAETKLSFDEGLLQAIFRDAPIGISVTDAGSGSLLMLNEKMKDLLGPIGDEKGGLERYAGYGAEHRDGSRYAVDDYSSVQVLASGKAVPWREMLYRRTAEDAVRHYEASSAPVHDQDGALVAVVTIVADVESERAAKAQAATLAALVEQTSDFISIADINGRVDYVNPAGLALLGLADPATVRGTELAGYFSGLCRTVIQTEAFPAAARTGHWEGELRLESPNGVRTPVLHTAFPLRDPSGAVVAYGGVTRDLTVQKEAQRHQVMLNQELSHRMKNMLAMVQSITYQTLRTARGLTEARDILSARIVALGKAHDLLLQDNSEAAMMTAIVETAVTPHETLAHPRFDIDGPELAVGPRAAMALSLMLHELATNAAKYGALSTPEGRVAVTWSIERPMFSMCWTETGGPPVVAPSQFGSGTRLIERGLAADVGGDVRLTYPPEGAVCSIRAALSALQAGT